MQPDQTTTASIIYLSPRGAEMTIRNREKLRRRLLRAIEDMVEDGFTTFILPIEEHFLFPTIAIDAILNAKANHPCICLTIMLPYQIDDECFVENPIQQYHRYCQYADDIIYNQERYICGVPSNSTEKLLSLSSAVITYLGHNCARLCYVMARIQHRRVPFININI